MTMLTGLVTILAIVVMANGNSLTGSFQQCNLQCTTGGQSNNIPPASTLLRGKSGPRGEKGEAGLPGVSCDQTAIEQLRRRINELEQESNVVKQLRPKNCSQIKEANPEASTGIYRIYKNIFDIGTQVTCDMTAGGSVIPFKNCKEIFESDNSSTDGVYTIQINSSTTIDVLCDMSGGGWTVFQNRYDGSESFNRNFNEYSIGFGDPGQEHWLGLDNIHQLTSQPGRWTLRVELETFQGETAFAQYVDFSVGEGTDYILSVGDYSGNAGNSLRTHDGSKFSTPDRDQDTWRPGRNCAQTYTGAWWYKGCLNSNLNSFKYGDKSVSPIASAFAWHGFKNKWIPLKSSQMKATIA